jgi:hypothetical protein
MTEINAHDFLEELRFDIETKDKIKARLVLTHFGEVDETTRRKALLELSRAPAEFTIPVLIALLAGKPEFGEEHPDLKEVLYSRALDSPDIVSQLMIREVKPNHRMALADLAGEIRLEAATPILLGILNEDDHAYIRVPLLG